MTIENEKMAGFPCRSIVRFVGAVYLAIFLFQLLTLVVNRTAFEEVFAYMSPRLYELRYAFSILLRLVGILGGIGLLMFAEWGRLVTIGVSLLSAVTVYWKHPYAAVLRISQDLDMRFISLIPPELGFSFVSFAPVIWAIICLMAVGFSAAGIYVLTRPKIKRVCMARTGGAL